MNDQFQNLFTPVHLGPVTVKNRLYMSAHTTFYQTDPTGYSRWAAVGDRAMHYYADRAKGGYGLIVVGALQVHPQAGSYRPGAWTRQARTRLTKIAGALHEHGAKVFVQLNQHGRLKGGSGSDDWWPMWTPSALLPVSHGLPHRIAGEMSKAMDVDEIKSLVGGFGKAAANAQRAGIDGAEVHIGHTHLLSEWLMPAFNHRTDEYGGSLDNRLRIIVEILDAIRKRCGRDFALGVRMNLEWPIPGGITHQDAIEIGQHLDSTGLLDFISCTMFPDEMAMPTNRLPPGFAIPKAAALKKAVGIPVIALGRIVHPGDAERILAEGLVDMVGMTKAGIADPELPNKAREGRADDIRPCIGAQQGCFARVMVDKPLSCTQNPAVGLERYWGIGTLTSASKRKRVLVAGGGPAGMEAAITAAQRGHEVVLCEKDSKLGGQVNLIGQVPPRDEFLGVVTWRQQQIEKLAIELKLDTEVNPALVEKIGPDAVVVATGSQPRANGWYPELAHLPSIPGGELPHVFTYRDVLVGLLDGKRHVVIVDGIGYHQSSDALDYLAARGCKVEAVAAVGAFAVDMLPVDRTLWLKSLRGLDVQFHTATMVHRILETAIEMESLPTGKRTVLEEIDAVVLSLGNDVNDALYQTLKGHVKELHRIGDCYTPRRIEQAIHEGHKVGREL